MIGIRRGEIEQLVRIPGVGKKTAERMVLELRDKLPAPAGGDEQAAAPSLSSLEEDVMSALLNLGCARPAAEAAIRKARAGGVAGRVRTAVPQIAGVGALMSNESPWFRPSAADDEHQFEAGLRPRRLADFTGQARLKENLQIAIEAARKRGEAMDHVLLYGPPGLGKTTLASIIAQELEVPFTQTSGPVHAEEAGSFRAFSARIQPRQVFFIDEIHRLLPDVEEMLYSALEDFHLDILIGTGPGARTHSMPLQKFTAIGATTRQGLVSAPMRSRFGLVLRLNHYDVAGSDS